MEIYSLKGKIISEDKKPLQNYYVLAYDHDFILNPDDLLGEAVTDSFGRFRIEFDKSKFAGFLEPLEGSPDVYLIVQNENKEEVLRTAVKSTQKEIEYHIKRSNPTKDLTAIDIYAGNARRFITSLYEVGNIIDTEHHINLDILANPNVSPEVKESLGEFSNRYEERRRNFETLLVTLSSLVETYLEDRNIGNIGYDGPQVPRIPRRELYEQTITWPRKEEFKWA